MTEHDSLERKIEKNADAIASLQVAMQSLLSAEEMKRAHVCNVHTTDLSRAYDDIQELKKTVANRWPSLIAAGIGAMLPVLGLVIGIWTSKG